MTAPLTEGTVHGSGWAHFAVTVGIWVWCRWWPGCCGYAGTN